MGKFMAKIRNFDDFGGCFPYFCANKREIWHTPPCQISRLSGQRVAPAVRKTYYWTTEYKQYRQLQISAILRL